MRMATSAVERGKQTLALGKMIGVVLVCMSLLLAKMHGRLARDERAQRDLSRREVAAGRSFELAVLAMAAGEIQEKKEQEANAAARTHTAFRPSPFAAADRSLRWRIPMPQSDLVHRDRPRRSRPTSRL